MSGAWTAVVASNVEGTKCGRVIFTVSGEGDVYSVSREGEGEKERKRERTETLKPEKAITKQCYLNKTGVGMQIKYRRLKIGSAGRY